MQKALRSFDSNGLADLLAVFSDLVRGEEEKALVLWTGQIGLWLKKN
jgi:hypothetical protein